MADINLRYYYYQSQRIISGSKNSKCREAYNLSYTDIYDFASKKQSLKKWEIELDIHHKRILISKELKKPFLQKLFELKGVV